MAGATSGTGQFASFDMTTGIIIDMDPLIYTYTALESPLLNGIGGDGRPIITSAPTDQVKFEQLSEKLLPPRSNLASAPSGGAGGTSHTAFAVTTGHGIRFKKYDLLRVITDGQPTFNEVVQVTAVTGDTLTVTRAYGGSTARDYTTPYATTKLVGIGNTNGEGQDPQMGSWKDRDADYNYCQIYGPHSMRATGTTMVVPRYGVPNEFARQLSNRQAEAIVAEEQSFIYGVRDVNATTGIRLTGGLLFMIPAGNKFGNSGTPATTPVTLTINGNTSTMQEGIVYRLQDCWNRGGVPDELLANPVSLGDLNATDGSLIRTTFEDPRRGRVSVMYVDTEFGSLDVVRHRLIAPMHAVGWKRANCRRRVLRPHQIESLGKKGDYNEVMFLAETGWEFKGTEHFFAYTNLNYAQLTEG